MWGAGSGGLMKATHGECVLGQRQESTWLTEEFKVSVSEMSVAEGGAQSTELELIPLV